MRGRLWTEEPVADFGANPFDPCGPPSLGRVRARDRKRLREGVLLKTLGASRAQIRRVMLSEYALLGGLGAASGILLSIAASWALLHFVFEQQFIPTVLPLAAVAGVMIALAIAIGLLIYGIVQQVRMRRRITANLAAGTSPALQE